MVSLLHLFFELSILQISFGSAFWPPTLDALEAFIDVIIEKKIPFVSNKLFE